MRTAVNAFDRDLQKQRQELQANLDRAEAAPLLALLDAIAVAKTQMTEEATRIFDYFLEGRADLAGERMATMDHKYASLNAALLELRRAVGAIQQKNFTEQTAAAAELQRYEYVIGLSIIFMVLGATLLRPQGRAADAVGCRRTGAPLRRVAGGGNAHAQHPRHRRRRHHHASTARPDRVVQPAAEQLFGQRSGPGRRPRRPLADPGDGREPRRERGEPYHAAPAGSRT